MIYDRVNEDAQNATIVVRSYDGEILLIGFTVIGKTHLPKAAAIDAARTAVTPPAPPSPHASQTPTTSPILPVEPSSSRAPEIVNSSPSTILAREPDSEHTRGVIHEILDSAPDHDTTLLISTNLTLEELESTLPPRTFSRLQALCSPLILRGRDHRQSPGLPAN